LLGFLVAFVAAVAEKGQCPGGFHSGYSGVQDFLCPHVPSASMAIRCVALKAIPQGEWKALVAIGTDVFKQIQVLQLPIQVVAARQGSPQSPTMDFFDTEVFSKRLKGMRTISRVREHGKVVIKRLSCLRINHPKGLYAAIATTRNI
jgi:hypothetical protein